MKSKPVDLSTFDGQLLDGLDFCRGVYDLFDQIQKRPDGIERLRLRKTVTDKKLIEELIPISRYVQARYQVGRRLSVQWFNGSQRYDAILRSRGGLVLHRCVPRRVLLEVTGSMHDNDYLDRQLLDKEGGSFGVKSISRDKKTKVVTSVPYGHKGDELMHDLASQILARLADKAAKSYPWNTVLIMQCFTDMLTVSSEWDDAIQHVKHAQPHIPFREVFLFESARLYSATLYGEQKRRS